MPITNIENFRGGLSLVEPSNIDDNQFEVLTNMFYNKDKRIQTRGGVANFGDSIWATPISSYFFWKNDTDGTTMALCTSGTNMYKYDEGTTTWNSIKTWLTEFEADGITRTRWSFAVYLNVVYMCNGVDDYADYDGTTYTTHWAQPLVRYLRYMADSIYWAWEDLNPSTIYATTAWAANADTIDANDIKVWGDELWRINGMLDLWSILLVFKNKKIYSVAWDLATSEAIDSANGGYCHRAIKNVENAIMYYNDSGIDRVKPRSWVVWSTAMASEPLGNDLRALLDDIHPTQRNNNTGYYNTFNNNYYFTFDTNNDSIPDTTLVYSSLVWAWSKYNLPSLYDYGLYIDSNWTEKILATSASGGQMYEIETWFQDFWIWIPTELRTKRWDFWDVGQWKTFDAVDIVWLKNEWAEITVSIIVDGEIVASSIINDDYIEVTGWSIPIWTTWIWIEAIGWGTTSTDWIELFQYLIRIPMFSSWPNLQVSMSSESNPNVWTLDKIKISREKEVMDIFPTQNIW